MTPSQYGSEVTQPRTTQTQGSVERSNEHTLSRDETSSIMLPVGSSDNANEAKE
jgi:hypothetical protein